MDYELEDKVVKGGEKIHSERAPIGDDEWKELLDGFFKIDEAQWDQIPVGSFIRWVRADGGRRKGATVERITTSKSGDKMFVMKLGRQKDTFFLKFSTLKFIYKQKCAQAVLEINLLQNAIQILSVKCSDMESRIANLEKGVTRKSVNIHQPTNYDKRQNRMSMELSRDPTATEKKRDASARMPERK